jgi:hypothetical protein
MLFAAFLWVLLVGSSAGSSADASTSQASPLLRATPFLMAHEAATYLMHRGDPNYKARRSQSISLVDQLSCGVRALDLRLVATAGSSYTQARLWSGDMEPDDEPDPANCTHCWVSNATETLETVVKELKGWCRAHPDELVLLVTSHCRSRDTAVTLDNWHTDLCTDHNDGDKWVPAFTELGVNTISSCPSGMRTDPTWKDAKAQAGANDGSCLLVVPGEGMCVLANYDSTATTIPAVKATSTRKLAQNCATGYDGMFQIQALCQGVNNETTCPQAALNGNVSEWLADGEFWHQCPTGKGYSGAPRGADPASGYPVNVLGVKDVCSLGPTFASALYTNASQFVRITQEDAATCKEQCGGQR